MDLETAKYIIDYFSNLMTKDEISALRYSRMEFKTEGNPKMRQILEWNGKFVVSEKGRELLKGGTENFRLNVAKRILKERKSDLFLNKCPKCNFLTRTPQSRQCRNCGHKWHNIKVADFKLNSSFQLTEKQFYLVGEIRNGNIKTGNFIDLTLLGLNSKPKIESIEFALKKVNGKATEDIALGTNELTENQKNRLKNIGSFGTQFDIVNER